MPIAWPAKDPNDVLDFGFNFGPLLNDADDTITDISATVEEGVDLVVVTAAVVPLQLQKVVVWLSGGQPGPAFIRLRATTSKGRVVDQTMSINIAER